MKIAIVGGSPTTKDLAPYDDPEWQIWGMMNRYTGYERADLLFEVHAESHFSPEEWQQYQTLYGAQMKHLEDQGKLVSPENYPYDDALELRSGRWCLQGAVSYMLAYAILQGVDEISLYGVDLTDNHEYVTQRPFVEGWIAFAEATGIKVTWPPQSALGWYTYKYGVEPYKADSYKAIKADAITKMLYNALKDCQLAQEKYRHNAAIVQVASIEAATYARVMQGIQRHERGTDITNFIEIDFKALDEYTKVNKDARR